MTTTCDRVEELQHAVAELFIDTELLFDEAARHEMFNRAESLAEAAAQVDGMDIAGITYWLTYKDTLSALVAVYSVVANYSKFGLSEDASLRDHTHRWLHEVDSAVKTDEMRRRAAEIVGEAGRLGFDTSRADREFAEHPGVACLGALCGLLEANPDLGITWQETRFE